MAYSEQSPFSPNVSILQWNVHNTASSVEVQEHLDEIAHTYGMSDITCLEEVLRKDSDVEDSFGSNHHFRPGSLPSKASPEANVEGISLQSNADTLRQEWYGETAISSNDPLMYFATLSTRRVCQLARFHVNSWDEELRLAHTHASPFVPGINGKQRRSERDALVDIVREHSKDGRFALVGDLNVGTSSKLIRALTTGPNRLTHLPTGPTYPSLRRTLDYAMISPDLEGTTSLLPIGPSDHFPLLSKIRPKD